MERCTGIVADNDGESRALLTAALTALEYDVVVADDPKTLDAAIQKHKTAVLLIAPSLPGLDPTRVCQKARSGDGWYYVICLLEQRTTEAVSTAFEADIDEILTKPLIPPELAARLEHARRVLTLERVGRALEIEGAWLAEIATTRTFHSRRYLEAQLENEVARSRRFAHSLSVILGKVNHNDDRITRRFGHLLATQLRSHIDWVAGYGVQHIALVLPETNLGGALRVGERVRGQVAKPLLLAAGLPPTFSMNLGISALSRESPADSGALLAAAEEYLNDAVRKGANQIAGGPAPRA